MATPLLPPRVVDPIGLELPAASSLAQALRADLVPDERRPDAARARRILVVDDDASTRALLGALVRQHGAEPVAADSARAARRFVEADGASAYDAVLTDQQMPEESGLELMAWIHRTDPTLAVVVVTASPERETVAASLRGGAAGLIDKPIVPAQVWRALDAAVDRTRHDRAHQNTTRVMREVGRLQRLVLRSGARVDPRLTVRSYPCHQAGGDFITSVPLDTGGLLLVVADVAGHDVASAYTAAYFQGLMRGMQESGRPIVDVMRRFNRVLLEEWSAASRGPGALEVTTSVAVCAIALDVSGEFAQVTNAGAPAPCHVNSRGEIRLLERGRSHPLGWFEESLPESTDHELSSGSALLAWTDGLEDLADRLGVPAGAVATALLVEGDAAQAVLAGGLRDDVLLAHLALGQPGSRSWGEPPLTRRWLPILAERHAGSTYEAVDLAQAGWEAAIRCVAPGIAAARLADILTAVREGMINALKHGCEGAADREADLQMSLLAADRVIRVRIEDPGPGHDFDVGRHAEEAGDDLVDLHRGLELIHLLSTTVRVERQGARLRLDFRY